MAKMWRCNMCHWQFKMYHKMCPKCGAKLEEFDPLHDEPQMPE